MLPFYKNPLIYRHSRPLVRRGRWAGILLLTVIGLAMLFSFCYMDNQDDYQYSNIQDPAQQRGYIMKQTWEDFSRLTMGLQVLIGFYFVFGATMDSVPNEKKRNAMDFFSALPLGPADKAVGLGWGPALLPAMLTVLLGVVAIFSGMLGGLEITKLLWFQLLMLIAMKAIGFTGTALSHISPFRTLGWIVLIPLFMIGAVMAESANSRNFQEAPLMVLSPYSIYLGLLENCRSAIFSEGGYHFFSWAVPWIVAPLVLYLFITLVMFQVARYRVMLPGSGRPLPRWQVILFTLILQGLLVGFLADSFRSGLNPRYAGDLNECRNIAKAYLVIWFLGLLFWQFLIAPTYAQLQKWKENRFWLTMGDYRTLPFLTTGALWLISTASLFSVNALYWENSDLVREDLLKLSVILLIFLWAYLCLMGVAHTLSKYYGRVLSIIVLACVTILPTIPPAIRDDYDSFLKLNPIGIVDRIYAPWPEVLWPALCVLGVMAFLLFFCLLRLPNPAKGPSE